MDEDLSKRIMANASLLFADASQRRRFGLPDNKENEDPSLPFGTLHWLRNPSGSLSTSNHETSFNSDIRRKASDPLSVSSHTSLFQTKNYRKPSPPKKAKVTTPTPTKRKTRSTKSWRRPMRRGSTDTSINIAERTMHLEHELTHYTPKN
jgi:hypothetical protein